MGEEELWLYVQAMQRGDAYAERLFLQDILPRLTGFLRRHFPDLEEDIPDIVNTTGRKLISTPHLIKRPGGIFAFCANRAKWIAQDLLRKRSKQIKIEWDFAESQRQIQNDEENDREKEELLTLIKEMLAELPEEERRLLLARFFDGMSLKEIAMRFGYASDHAVGMRILRCYPKAQKILKKLSDEEQIRH